METKISLVPTNNAAFNSGNDTHKEDKYVPSNKPKPKGFYRKEDNRAAEPQNAGESKPKEAQQYQKGQGFRGGKGYQQQEFYPQAEYYGQGQGYGWNQQAEYGQGGRYEYDQGYQGEIKFNCEFPRAQDYSDMQSVAQAFPALKDVNTDKLNIDGLKDVRCFILRSSNEDDIHKAVKYGIWTSTAKSNEFLNNVYEECAPKNIPVFLFFSVVRSGQFVGVAQMTSKIIEKSFQYWWEPDKWVNHFQIKWIFIKDMPYKFFSHLYMDDNLPVTRARDCTGVPVEVTKEMLRIYRDYNPYNSIFSAFAYMDGREDMLRSYRTYVQSYQRFMTTGMSPNGGYMAQNTAANQPAPQYFKYNAFPAKQKDTKQAKPASPSKGVVTDLENLYKEFELTFSFYNDEKKKWEKEVEQVNKLNNSDDKTVEEITMKFENLKSREKEIMEGLEILDNKYKTAAAAVHELDSAALEKTVKDKHTARVAELSATLEKFKQEFSNSEKVMTILSDSVKKLNNA